MEALEEAGGAGGRRWEEPNIGARNRDMEQPEFLVINICTKGNLKRKDKYTREYCELYSTNQMLSNDTGNYLEMPRIRETGVVIM